MKPKIAKPIFALVALISLAAFPVDKFTDTSFNGPTTGTPHADGGVQITDSDIDIGGDATVGGDLQVTGELDIVALMPTGEVLTLTGDFLPEADGTRDLGSTSTRWANAWLDALAVTGESALGTLTVGGGAPNATIDADGNVIANGLLAIGGQSFFTGLVTLSDGIIGPATQNLFDTVSTTINLGGAATTMDIGAATGQTTVKNALDIDLILTAGTGPTTITNAAGEILSSALESKDSFSGLWQNTGTTSAATHVTSLNEFSQITAFVNVGLQDAHFNAVGSAATNDVTLGVDGAGTYDVDLSISAIGTAVNKDYWFGIAHEPATEPVITSSTDATPIVVTAVAHDLQTGDGVIIAGHATNDALNASHLVTVTGVDTFSVQDLSGANVAGTGGGAGSGGTITHIVHGSSMKVRRFANSSDVGAATITGSEEAVATDKFIAVVGGISGSDNISIVSVNMRVCRISD